MKVSEAIEMRKSIRKYAAKEVEEGKITAVLRAGNLAPVFGRFHITVIAQPELLQKINETTLDMMRHSGNEFLEKRAATKGYAPLYGAPVLILLSASGGNDSNGFNMANVSCAAENMILEAVEQGLGTCFVMGPMMAFSNPQLRKEVKLSEEEVPLVGVLLGYPEEEPAVNGRKEPDNITYIKSL